MNQENLINKLVLGTAQFGLKYGINNSGGQPLRDKSLTMLNLAYDKGIIFFDTARAYGDAEEIIGEFSASRDLSGQIKIITKLAPNAASGVKDKISDIIEANLAESLKRLKRNFVDGYLLHTPEDVRRDRVVSALVNLKKQGLVKNIGVSVYEEPDAIYAAKLKEIDYIQVPYNIFDQRLDRSDFFRLAKENGKTVFARSVFLQGLLLMPEKKIPPHLKNAKAYLKKLDEIIKDCALTRIQAALSFVLSHDKINYVVFGVDDINQLTEIIALVARPLKHQDCFKRLVKEFFAVEKNIISPNLWKS